VLRNLFLLAGVSGLAATSQLTQARIALVQDQVAGLLPQVQAQVTGLVPQVQPLPQADPMVAVVDELRRVAEEIAADPRYADDERVGPDEDARQRFREFAKKQLG